MSVRIIGVALAALHLTLSAAPVQARVTGTSPSLALDEYVGTYTDPMYGEATVTGEDGRLRLRQGTNYVGELEHWHFDTFRVVWSNPTLGRSFVTFMLSPTASVSSLDMPGLATFQQRQGKTAGEGAR